MERKQKLMLLVMSLFLFMAEVNYNAINRLVSSCSYQGAAANNISFYDSTYYCFSACSLMHIDSLLYYSHNPSNNHTWYCDYTRTMYSDSTVYNYNYRTASNGFGQSVKVVKDSQDRLIHHFYQANTSVSYNYYLSYSTHNQPECIIESIHDSYDNSSELYKWEILYDAFGRKQQATKFYSTDGMIWNPIGSFQYVYLAPLPYPLKLDACYSNGLFSDLLIVADANWQFQTIYFQDFHTIHHYYYEWSCQTGNIITLNETWQLSSVTFDCDYNFDPDGYLFSINAINTMDLDYYVLYLYTNVYYDWDDTSDNSDPVMIDDLSALSAYPNPFLDSITFKTTLSAPTQLDLTIYNCKGQKIKKLYSGYKNAGECRFIWDGKSDSGNRSSAGIYIIKMDGIDFVITKRIVIR